MTARHPTTPAPPPGHHPGAAISARGLVKTFGKLRAVDGIDLEVPPGIIFAILGPNGAGKTTLMRMLATLAAPDSGSAEIFGLDLARQASQVRGIISMTGQFASLDEDLSGRENLILLSRLWGLGRAEGRRRAAELLAAFDLDAAARKQVRSYSGGMRRRLDIAASLIVTPRLLFLDEPTTGLDPRARQEVWRIIRELRRAGVTILLTTQYLDEADQLAARIAVIDHGRKIAEGTSRELKAAVGAGFLHLGLADAGHAGAAASLLEDLLGGTAQIAAEGSTLSIPVDGPDAAREALAALGAAGVELTDFSMGRPSLDEVFFALTGHPAEPEPDEMATPPASETSR